MPWWRHLEAACDLPGPGPAGRQPDSPEIKPCVLYLIVTLGVLLSGFIVFRLAHDIAGYYVVEISIDAASDFPAATIDGSSMAPASFNVTARVDNRYHHYICFSDWSVAVFYDGVPLGRGYFPDDLCALSRRAGSTTVATTSGLVGLPDEVRARVAGKTWRHLELQVDMRHHVLLADSCADEWLRCTTNLGSQTNSSSCRFRISKRL
ncbi:hypothetical protein QOZ80_1AG0026280 [Eleusine coracana subsp. coracana]|nr:hypothetical protein QOZ80_1AG0026280 [Eleusine coracana subsp. coracana]